MGIGTTEYGNLKPNEVMGTQSVQIDTGILDIVRDVKEKLGFPIARFIEEVIVEKVVRLPKRQKEKLNLIAKSNSKQSKKVK